MWINHCRHADERLFINLYGSGNTALLLTFCPHKPNFLSEFLHQSQGREENATRCYSVHEQVYFFPLLSLFAISVHPSSFQKQLLDQLSTIQYESLTTALLVHRMQVVALWWTVWELHLVIRLTRKTQRNKAVRFKMLMLIFIFWLVLDPELISHLSWKELKWTSACDVQEVKLLLENHP